ncbi:MAG: sulfite exporter TauE/SafE family protein [Terracidiphilus sp.]
MTALEFTLIVLALSVLAGLLGALTGLGGGVVVVPALTLALGVDMKYAIGASLVSVIATSSGAAAAYVREGFSNIRIGMFLEIATTMGAILGAFLASRISTHALAIVFGLILLQAAFMSFKGTAESKEGAESDALAKRLRLGGAYPDEGSQQQYGARHVPGGFALMFGAGTLSGLLGIGSGAVKVIAMDRIMRIPFKVSTTTSNFMIGVTAAASAGLYLRQGYIKPQVTMPVMLGVLAGALLGAKLLVHMRVKTLRTVFGIVILALAIEMIFKGITGGV